MHKASFIYKRECQDCCFLLGKGHSAVFRVPTAFWWFPYKNVETSRIMNLMHELCSKVRHSKGLQCFIHFLYPKKGASSLQDFSPIKSTRKILAKMHASRLWELLSIIISH